MRRLSFALLMTLLWASPALAQVTVVGSEGKDCGSITTCSPNSGIATQAGDFLVLTIVRRNDTGLTGVSDATNGAWTCDANLRHTGTGRLAAICYFQNSASATITPTVTIPDEDTTSIGYLVLREMSADGGIDDYATNANGDTTTHSHGEITTASTAGAVVTVFSSTPTGGGWTTATNFVELFSHDRAYMQYRVSGAASLTTTASVTSVSNASTGAVIASFFAAPASSGPRRGLLLGVGQ